MILDVTCTDSGILAISKIIKNIFYWLQIIGPILAMIALAINIAKIVSTNKDNEIKKYHKSIINSLIAMAMLFLLPYIMDTAMVIIGNKVSFSSCWNSIDNVTLKSSGKYINATKETNNKKKTKVYIETKDYHGKTKTTAGIVTNITTDSGEKIARFGAQLAGYATGKISTGGDHWPGWYPNHGSIYLTKDTGGSGTYPNIGIGYKNYKELPNELTNLHNFWFVQDMTSRYPKTKEGIKTYWGENAAYAGMWPIVFATIRGSYDPSFNHSSNYLDNSVKNGIFQKFITTFSKLDEICKPGDIIGGANMGHVWIWIGNDIVKEYWPNAPSTAKMLTASGQEGRWPNIVNSNYGVWKGNVNATIYRPTGKVIIDKKNPLVIDLTKFGLLNNDGFNSEESSKREAYCNSNWPHLSHK